MNRNRFRLLLLAYLALVALSVLAGLLPDGVPAEVTAAHEAATDAQLDRFGWLWVFLLLAFLLASIVGWTGMFLCRRWGRSLSLAGTVVGLALYLPLGFSVSSGWESLFFDASNLLWGALLAWSYAPPINGCFETGEGIRA